MKHLRGNKRPLHRQPRRSCITKLESLCYRTGLTGQPLPGGLPPQGGPGGVDAEAQVPMAAGRAPKAGDCLRPPQAC